jgi:hypothetical protein
MDSTDPSLATGILEAIFGQSALFSLFSISWPKASVFVMVATLVRVIAEMNIFAPSKTQVSEVPVESDKTEEKAPTPKSKISSARRRSKKQ